MVDDLQRRLVELRFLPGIQKVEHVPYQTGDEFWIRFDDTLDLKKLERVAKNHGASIMKFGGLPAKLPRPLAELLWNGVSHVITKSASGWTKFTSSLGFEPDGIAKIVADAHGPYQIFIAKQEEGIQILYEYLGLKYTPPAPSPKPVSLAKTPIQSTTKPPPPAQQTTSPATPSLPAPTASASASSPNVSVENPPPKSTAQA
jgi:hypothetical protein